MLKSFSRQKHHKTVLKVVSCKNEVIKDIHTVYANVKTVSLSLTALFFYYYY